MTSPAPDSPEAPAPVVTPPASYGPIRASSVNGVPFIAVKGPVNHYSGKRLSEAVMAALTQAQLTIPLPD